MSAIKQTCKRFVIKARVGGCRFEYQCPVKAVDRKREGRYLRIGEGHQSITLDGFVIRTMARILGETGQDSVKASARGHRFCYQPKKFLRIGRGHQSILISGRNLKTVKHILRWAGETGCGRFR